MTLRRGALWALLAAKLVGGWGVGWDIRWHLLIGRDSFWIAPHVMAYAAVAATAIISLGVFSIVFTTLLKMMERWSTVPWERKKWRASFWPLRP